MISIYLIILVGVLTIGGYHAYKWHVYEDDPERAALILIGTVCSAWLWPLLLVAMGGILLALVIEYLFGVIRGT